MCMKDVYKVFLQNKRSNSAHQGKHLKKLESQLAYSVKNECLTPNRTWVSIHNFKKKEDIFKLAIFFSKDFALFEI